MLTLGILLSYIALSCQLQCPEDFQQTNVNGKIYTSNAVENWLPVNVTSCAKRGYQIHKSTHNDDLCYKRIKCENESEVIHDLGSGNYSCGPRIGPSHCTDLNYMAECSLLQISHPERWTQDRPAVWKVIAHGKPPGLCSTTTCGSCDLCENITSFDDFGHIQLHDGSVHVVYKFFQLLVDENGSPIGSTPDIVCFGNPNGNTTGTMEACERMYNGYWDTKCLERGDRLCVFSGQYHLIYRPRGSTRTIPIRAYAPSVETEYYEFRDQNITCKNSQIILSN